MKIILKLLITILITTIVFAKPTTINLRNVEVLANCDQVLINQYQRKCYNYEAKKPLFNFYYLTKDIVNRKMKKRPSFKMDKRIKEDFNNNPKCYKYQHFDRGHLAPDADFDYNKQLLKTTYLMSNIVPERPRNNRVLVAKIETEFRKYINEFGDGYILTGAHYTFEDKYKFNPKMDCGYYPDYIYKIFWNPKKNFLIGYKITNTKPFKIIKIKTILIPKFLKDNNIILRKKYIKGNLKWTLNF